MTEYNQDLNCEKEYRQDFTFEVINPILYQDSDSSSEQETTTLVLYAPSNKLSKQKDKLRQQIIAAFLNAGKNSNAAQTQNNKEEKKSLESEEILFAIAASENCINIKEEFKKLLIAGCGSLDGKVTIGMHHIETISDDELEELMGQYIINFIIASWMKRLFEK